ncbi:MAG: ApaG domain [Akkermansia sp.]
MNTECRSLPVRDFLAMRLSAVAMQYTRSPRPQYRLCFRLNMTNEGSSSVRLLGRKWILRERNGCTRIIEAEQVFNQRPVLMPGEVFAYSGYRILDTALEDVELRFFGTDRSQSPFISPPLRFPRRCFSRPRRG